MVSSLPIDKFFWIRRKGGGAEMVMDSGWAGWGCPSGICGAMFLTARLAAMAMIAEETPALEADKVHALVKLLRSRSYEEIRQRMYDNPPGSAWWVACKTELDIRNGEQMAAALSATSHVLEKLRGSTKHFEQLAETL